MFHVPSATASRAKDEGSCLAEARNTGIEGAQESRSFESFLFTHGIRISFGAYIYIYMGRAPEDVDGDGDTPDAMKTGRGQRRRTPAKSEEV